MISDEQVGEALRAAGLAAPVLRSIDPDVVRARAARRRRADIAAVAVGLLVVVALAVTATRGLLVAQPAPVTTPIPSRAALPPIPDASAASVDGRVLVTVTTVLAGSGAAASRLAYVDSAGLHEIPLAAGLDPSGAVWATHDSVVFAAGPPGGAHLYTTRVDGTDARRLTSDAGSQDDPAVSRDGSTVVFVQRSEQGVNEGLRSLSLRDGRTESLTPAVGTAVLGAGDEHPTYSADGSQIAFVRVVDGNTTMSALWTVRSDGTGLRRLTPDATATDHPRWSPDGTRILYSQGRAYSTSSTPVWLVDVAGGPPRPVLRTADGSDVWDATWSPDGTHLASVRYPPGTTHNELRITAADGTDARTLWTGTDGLGVQSPDWTS